MPCLWQPANSLAAADWQLHPMIFGQIDSFCGPHDTDARCLPIGENALLPHFWSPADDACSHSWAQGLRQSPISAPGKKFAARHDLLCLQPNRHSRHISSSSLTTGWLLEAPQRGPPGSSVSRGNTLIFCSLSHSHCTFCIIGAAREIFATWACRLGHAGNSFSSCHLQGQLDCRHAKATGRLWQYYYSAWLAGNASVLPAAAASKQLQVAWSNVPCALRFNGPRPSGSLLSSF